MEHYYLRTGYRNYQFNLNNEELLLLYLSLFDKTFAVVLLFQ